MRTTPLSKALSKTVATLITAATCAVGLTTLTNTPAKAVEPTPAYATASITKLADGTGHGTTAQTFINSKNGFAPGDDTPDDGVVASSDTVTYRVNLSFTAAKKRQVKVKWDLSEASYLESRSMACVSGRLVTAQASGSDTCVYTVPAGAVESITQTFSLTAKGTNGVAQSGQMPKLTVSRDEANGESITYRADAVTVVSAPAADLETDNGGMPDNTSSNERRNDWSENGTANGYFNLKIVPLHYEGYSGKGASTSGQWSATVNVKAFPDNTVWTLGSQPLTMRDGKLRIENVTGSQRLNYSFKYADMKTPMAEDSTQYLDIQVTPDEGSFATGDGENRLENLGDGSEPGRGKGRDDSTYDAKTGSIKGYPYANNDWSRAVIDRYDPPVGSIFWKTLEKPYRNGYTVFDAEMQTFASAGGSQTVSHGGSSTDRVARHAEVRVNLNAYGQRIKSCGDSCKVVIGDYWDDNSRYKGNLQVTIGGRVIDPGMYTVEWAATRAAADDDKADWKTTPVDTDRARSIRVKLSDDLPFGDEQGAGITTVSFLVDAYSDPGDSNITATDWLTGTFTGAITVDGSKTDSDYYVIIAPGKPGADISYMVSIKDGNGQIQQEAQPEDTVTWTARPRVNNVQSSKTTLTPTVTIPLPKGVLDPVNRSEQWNMRQEDGKLIFTLNTENGDITPSYSQSGFAMLPDITWEGRVGNLASGSVSGSATLNVHGSKVGVIPAFDIQADDGCSFTVPQRKGSAGVITALQDTVEINEPISFEWNIYTRDSSVNGEMKTIIRMPSNEDEAMTGKDNTGLDGSWNEYDMGSSAYHGSYTIAKEPAITAVDSTATTLKYSTSDRYSDNPNDYTWKTWGQLTSSDKQHLTAILVVSQPQQLTEGQAAASHGTVTLNPTGNKRDDKYNMWLGANRVNGVTEKIPWPATSKVVAGSITGTVWWDKDENTRMDADEERIPGITVSLWQVDGEGNKQGAKPLATASTNESGEYKFDLLHSGDYVTEVKRSEGTVTDTGVQTRVNTYFNQTKDVSNTRSWLSQLKDNAKDTSTRIHLLIGQKQNNVDFGYAKPDPKATLDKTQTGLTCDDTTCTINWDVKITNNGKTTTPAKGDPLPGQITAGNGHSLALDTSVLNDRMSGIIQNVSATAGTISRTEDQYTEFTQITAGLDHSLALDSDGHLWAWGYNIDGQLGDGTIINRHTPVQVKSDKTFTQITAGGSHSLALDSDGHLWAWGLNGYGQLGDGTTTDRHTPVQVKSDKTFTQITAGNFHSLALDSDGHLWAWGYIKYGELGDGTRINQCTPVRVKLDKTFTQITAGKDYSLALDSDGHLWEWENNNFGQLGDGSTTNQNRTPVQVKPDTTFTQIAVGSRHSLALASDGHLWAWGDNLYGQLGNDSENIQYLTPVRVKSDKTFTQITAGGYSSLALDSDGHLWAWGDNRSGQLGDGTTTFRRAPVQVKSDKTFTQITAGYSHSLAVDSDGHLWAWGENSFGQLGDGTTTASRRTPTDVTLVIPGVSVDPTAVPVTPISESSDNSGDVLRTYNLPFTVEPGGSVVFHFTGTLARSNMVQKVYNQAWFTSPDTPYSGTPNAVKAGVSEPKKPDMSKLDKNSHDITGNVTCKVGSDFKSPDMEHWFSISAEDLCDQVGVELPAVAGAIVFGSVSGLYWEDTNRNGVRDSGETSTGANQQVILYKDGEQYAETTTKSDGSYKFTRLPLGSYTVRFSRVPDRDFTQNDANDSMPKVDKSSTDSDAGLSEDDYGMGTPTVTLTNEAPDKQHVDAGILPPKPRLFTMPHTGLGMLLPVILLVGVGGLVGSVILLRRKPEDTVSSSKGGEASGE